jgi:molybdopterin/thiamine biosynthesis adenylyltransferase
MLSDDERERYLRQIIALDEKSQEILKSKKVLIVGAGGLGSPLELYLTAAGVGEIVLFEMDTVSLSNLGRQILYDSTDLGKSKAQLAKAKLERLNPHVKITIIEQYLTHANAKNYVKGVDYLVDASDNFNTKFLINDLGLEYNIPFTIAGIEGFDGQIISVTPHKSACYRCLFSQPPTMDKSKPIPVVGPVCGVMGSLQAAEVIKGLLHLGNRIENSLLMVSLREAEFHKIPIKPNPRCGCCENK